MLPPGARPVHAISRGLLQDLPLLAQDLVLTSQPLQLGRHVLLALRGRVLDLTLTAAADPVTQGRQADPEILGNRPSAAATGQGEPYSLIPKLFGKALVGLGHGDPPGSLKGSPFSRSKSIAPWRRVHTRMTAQLDGWCMLDGRQNILGPLPSRMAMPLDDLISLKKRYQVVGGTE